MSKRHKWDEKVKHYGGETHTCRNCGMQKILRHAGGFHWTEWKDVEGNFIDFDKTPPCDKEQQ